MLRSPIVGLFILLFLILTSPVLLFFKLTNKKHLDRNRKIAAKYVRFVFKGIIFLSGIKVSISGMENIPEDEAVLFIANHRSYFDIVTAYPYFNREIGYIAKIELKKIPLFYYWMEMVCCLFLDRDDVRQGLQTILAGADMIKEGKNMWIFPEGTRGQGDELLEFKEGSLKIAEKADCAIVPVAIKHTDDIFEKHFPWIKAKHVTIQVGTPVYPKRIDRKEKKGLGAKMRSTIQEMYNEMD